jgi:hypothetical protein
MNNKLLLTFGLGSEVTRSALGKLPIIFPSLTRQILPQPLLKVGFGMGFKAFQIFDSLTLLNIAIKVG